MTDSTAVYIQLTASLVGAKYQQKDLIIMNNWYQNQVKFLKAKRNVESDKATIEQLNGEIANYERAIRQSEPAKPKGVDAYLS